MPEFSNMADLEKYVNELISNSLESDVAKVAEETMQYHIQLDVYKAYTPYSTDGQTPHYERTGQLLSDVETNMESDNTLVVQDTRSENGRDIVQIIEDGGHYAWGYTRNLDEEIGKRPFVENTFKDLENGLAQSTLKQSLIRQGLDAE